ncbi:DUF4190 domain-containing protein [Brevibacterium oceani]|uniref:DUF4190 domain-containing protein n=1 Tax=Brevibacterium oceani TaxID=358099 RepID=UPI0015E6F167|nr:DUF4190 domain-containing protein [Brevibacterium oceani]
MNAAPAPTPGQFDQPQSTGPALPPHSPLGYPDAPQSYQAAGSYQHQRTEEDPGKVLGIISLVATLSTFLGFNFIGPVVGIITGHIARRRSREDGRADNEMGKWGLILGYVFLGLLVLGWVLGISFGIVSGLAGLMAG